MIKTKFQHELVRYFFVGSINTVSGFILIFVFRSIFHLDPYSSNALSFLCCHFTAFKLHKRYTFRVSSSAGNIWKFSLVILLSWLINILALSILISVGIIEYVSQGLAMVIYVVASFFLHRLFTFAWVVRFKHRQNWKTRRVFQAQRRNANEVHCRKRRICLIPQRSIGLNFNPLWLNTLWDSKTTKHQR